MYYHALFFADTAAASDVKAGLSLEGLPLLSLHVEERALSSSLHFQTKDALDEASQATITQRALSSEVVFNHPKAFKIITQADLYAYAEASRRIHVGAADERQDDGSYGEDGIEKYVADLDYAAALQNLIIACAADGSNVRLEAMNEEQKATFAEAHEDNKATRAAIEWAKTYYTPRYDPEDYGDEGPTQYGEPPEVEALLSRLEDNLWRAELWISNNTQKAIVIFSIDGDGHVWPSRIEYPDHSTFFEYTEVNIWHQERKEPGDWTEYYLLIKDGEQTIPLIVKYNAAKKAVASDVYVPPDHDYTIHDGCDHEYDYCCLEDPRSSTFAEATMLDKYAAAIQAMERQFKQRTIADALRADKAKMTES